MQNKVCNRLKGLLLTHDEANLLCLFVAKKLTVSSSTLLPLLISEAVKLASNLEDALFFLLSGDLLNFGKFSLFKRILDFCEL